MYLSEKQKNDLRYEIKMKLDNSFISSRIHIDKELLEQLLFDEGYYDGVFCKSIVWSGDFLSKIDLSEISFDNVIWKSGYRATDRGIMLEAEKVPLNFNNTNIKFNFNNAAFVGKKFVKDAIIDCSFNGIDLRNTGLFAFKYYDKCCFDNCVINFCFDNVVRFYECSFENANIVSGSISSNDLYKLFYNCNFSNSNLNIYHNPNTSSEKVNDYLISLKNKGYLEACRINGYLYDDNEKLYHKRDTSVSMYTDSIIKDIDKQVLIYNKKI